MRKASLSLMNCLIKWNMIVKNGVKSFYIPFLCHLLLQNRGQTMTPPKCGKVKVKAKTNLKRKWNPEENLDDFNESAEMEEV